MSVAAVNRFVPSQFLDGLSAEALTAVLQVAKRRQFSANSVVLHQGYPSEHLFLLTHGRARHFFITENGQKVVMRWLVPGDITGGMALLARLSRYQVSTEAVKDSQFLIWDRITLGCCKTCCLSPRFFSTGISLLMLLSVATMLARGVPQCSRISPTRLDIRLLGALKFPLPTKSWQMPLRLRYSTQVAS